MEPGDEPVEDPFSAVSFDEDFVKAAPHQELSAAERLAAAQAAFDELASLRQRHRRSQLPHRRLSRTLRGHHRRLGVVVLCLSLVLFLGWRERSEIGGAGLSPWSSGGGGSGSGLVRNEAVPTPQPKISDGPLGTPMSVTENGPYKFMFTQPGTDQPVAYDPCRPIPVVINHRASPPNGGRMITEALTELTRVTGLRFDVEGASTEVPSENRDAFQPDLYNDRWAPVLIAWSDPAELPRLAGPVAGLGGSAHTSRGDKGVNVYVSGSVTLDGPQLTEIIERGDGWDQARSVVLHELAHVVGLDHVDDPTQLMHGQGHPNIVEFQAGDLAGLVQLGQGECVPEL